MNMSVADYIQIALLLVTLAGFGFGQLSRWAVANHRDRLAMLSAAAGNAAGGIRLAVSSLPPGADVAGLRALMVKAASEALLAEFATTAGKLGATPEKAAKLISDQLVPPAAVSVVLSAPAAVMALLPGLGSLGADVAGSAVASAVIGAEAAAMPVLKALGTIKAVDNVISC